MKRVWLVPFEDNAFLRRVIDYFADGRILILELAHVTPELLNLNDRNQKMPSFKTQYSKRSGVVCLRLNPSSKKKVQQAIAQELNLKKNIGAIHIYNGDELVFLAGDNFHPECISFLAVSSTEPIIKELLESGLATLVARPTCNRNRQDG